MSSSPAPVNSLTGVNAALAIEPGLAEADLYTTSVPKDQMRVLLQRRNGPAIRDTLLLFAILVVTAWATVHFWGTWWVVLPYLIYAVFYATSSDSRWHECGHGTAFKTDWMNSLLYEVASFMVMRESVVWRWSHNRHHSDTLIVGRDPEIQIPRPPDLRTLFLSLLNVGGYLNYFPSLTRHAFGKMSAGEKTYIPESEFPKVFRKARICLALHLVVIGSAYMFSLRPSDTLSAVGPFGDFHIRPTQREMVYIGGGSGMAPLRSHITHLFESQATAHKVSFWYGARSRQELFYQDHFDSLAVRFPNFTFHPALSSPLDSDAWTGMVGFIHDVAFENYLKNHAHPRAVEFYLCGPPQMMKACQKMLRELGVEDSQITFDEF